MRRRAFLTFAGLALALPARAATQRYRKGLLWRVTRKGSAPSHVYGTIHVPDPRVADMPRPVRDAFARSRSLMVEFVPDGYARERFVEAAMYLDRRTLRDELGAEDFERAVEQLAPIGLSREFVAKLKPWGVLLNLREAAGAAVSPKSSPLDTQLLELAQERRIPLAQIEEVEEQVFTFDELPMESQVALLRHALAHREELRALAEGTLQAYLAGDLGEIWRLREEHVRRHPAIAAHQAVLTKRVLLDRNVVMAFRMQRELRRGHAFVALGALHLYGEKGVLALLAQDGYRAARVY
jgi:uncharacterized protein YbaP (TraB family)